jgi:hypothetical protein
MSWQHISPAELLMQLACVVSACWYLQWMQFFLHVATHTRERYTYHYLAFWLWLLLLLQDALACSSLVDAYVACAQQAAGQLMS